MILKPLDVLIFFLYILVIMAIGFWVGRRAKRTMLEYFLAGDKLPWYAIGFSIVASGINTEQLLEEVGFARTEYLQHI